MAGTLWIPGAERLPVSAAGGTISSSAPPRAVWHTTEADPGTSTVWTSMIRVLNNKSAEPQVLYDPVTDGLGQFMPLNVSGRALRNDGTTRTNRVGKVCIQIEVIGRSAKPFTGYWKPGKNWRALMAALRSWGIPDVQPAGPFPKFVAVGTGGYNSPENDRDRTTWLKRGGHFSHSQIPGNDHGDPGAVSFSAMLAAGKAPTTTTTGDDMPLTTADLDAVQDRAYKANSKYAIDFWVAPTGTGTAIRNLLAAMKQQLDRIEDDTDAVAETRALLEEIDKNVDALKAEAAPKA